MHPLACLLAQYNADRGSIRNRFIHLTNYSVQKKSNKFVEHKPASDAEGDEAAHKWSLSTFRQRLKRQNIDDGPLWAAVNDIVIKTCVSIEAQVGAALDTHAIDPRHCFQLFGFDILVDSQLKPWLLEVNLSPSMACDSQLDLGIKGPLLADLLTLVEARPCTDPNLGSAKPNNGVNSGNKTRRRSGQHTSRTPPVKSRHGGGSSINTAAKRAAAAIVTMSLSGSEKQSTMRAIRALEDEDQRKGDWNRIFPLADNWPSFKKFFQGKRLLNELQASYLEQRGKEEAMSSSGDADSDTELREEVVKNKQTRSFVGVGRSAVLLRDNDIGGLNVQSGDGDGVVQSGSDREETDGTQRGNNNGAPRSLKAPHKVVSMALGRSDDNECVRHTVNCNNQAEESNEGSLNAAHLAELKHLARQDAANKRRKDRAKRAKGIFGLSELL
jgi:hypothetical protein